ncbi:metN, D-methionine transport system ATP-binding protein [Nostoc flagelliforme CCNUN1]|uniref:MetN, D-methionine transport system ATP-binding protein n=1 Tax=Nostoc flagelliforme CCNUN1 TaxID=2038116 RepID=A0A2K8SIN6_9NOSO|nr:ATP-binding cassette domain-containing protein [Nostoc flagelliforme]AUB35312.1 metN, D-methionine transport system ATP-binding protein [Nostoc flagelliforme CCNUN1]
MIAFTDVRKVYNQGSQKVVALDGVSLLVKPGEIFGVLGQSGAGKSTLIRCVNQLEKPTSGSVVVDGQEMTKLSGDKLRQARQRIGMIFQHFNLLSCRTVVENIAFPLEVMGYSRLKRRAKVEELISLVGLTGKADAYPAQLSGGQKQRVGIARALAGEPKVLLSDEATSALDPQTTRSILDLLRDLNKRMGLTILLITHEMAVVKQICDSVAVLNAGKIVEKGYVSDLIAKPESFLSQEFFPHRNGYKPKPGAVIATIAFAGEQASQPIFATLARNFDVDVNILSGSVETVGDRRVGQFHVELEGQKVIQALKYLHEAEFEVQVH